MAMCIVFVAVLRTPYDVDHPEKGHLIDALNREMTTKDNPWDIEFNNEDIVDRLTNCYRTICTHLFYH